MNVDMSNLSIAIVAATVAVIAAYFGLMRLGKWAEKKHEKLKHES
ncbi:hypothetical protein [Thioalkalivibrio sp. ALMg11]|nr:hypothetical protein [Thioalkalivibrio sp. ALMg11]